MKIVIMTLHDTDNCGSSLQAFALQKYIQMQEHDCEIINYIPLYTKTNGRNFRYLIKKIIAGKILKERKQQFNEFRDCYLNLTSEVYKSYWKLVHNPPQADLYIVGSDQLWNDSFKCGKDLAFYLNFVKGVKKVAYAVSLGKEAVSRKQLERIKKYTHDYELISVREKCSQQMLINMGIMETKYVCDPTLLLNKMIYHSMSKKEVEGEYILVYMIPRSKLLDSILSRLQKIYSCKIVYVGGKIAPCRCDVHISVCAPNSFLGLIENAAYIVAGSFHALIFSCIFNKEFIILPYKNNARMEQFLKEIDCGERYVQSNEEINIIDEKVDFEKVNSKIYDLVKNSKKILEEVLK